MHRRPNIKGRDISSIRANLNNHSPALILLRTDLRVCKDILGLIFAKFHLLRLSDFAEKDLYFVHFSLRQFTATNCDEYKVKSSQLYLGRVSLSVIGWYQKGPCVNYDYMILKI